MTPTRALVITGNGTNCEMEAAHACKLGGFDEARIAHIAEILSGEVRLDDYHFLNLTGGFLDGDDLGSAKAGANRLLHAPVRGRGEHLIDQVLRFIEAGKLVMGVCNGFQLMVKMGMLPALDGNHLQQTVTLSHNDSGRFQDRWCYLKTDPQSPCIFTTGIDKGIYLPVRHGEGKFFTTPEIQRRLAENQQIALRYAAPDGRPAQGAFPLNPNGSLDDIAGICDATGRVFGLMPHPEAYNHWTNHPQWPHLNEKIKRGSAETPNGPTPGIRMFANAVHYFTR